MSLSGDGATRESTPMILPIGPEPARDHAQLSRDRLAADAKPSHECRFPAQHQPTLGEWRLLPPSLPVPLLIQRAGVRGSNVPSGLRKREPIVMKQWLRAKASGC
jgi:hypothetical protein